MPRGRQYYDPFVQTPPPAVDVEDTVRAIRAFVVEQTGPYVLIEDVAGLLKGYAAQYDEQGNPSAAVALREAADALSEPF